MTETIFDKTSKMPIHHQLYVYIKKCIEEGVYKPNEKIPSESEMQKQFDISRITVRRAIDDLAHDGYLQKHHGLGTIVMLPREQSNVTKLSSFSQEALRRGDRPASVILKLQQVPANIKVAQSLRVEIGQSVYFLKRLRMLNGALIGVHNTYIALRAELDLKADGFTETTSLYDYFEKHGIALDSADEIIEAQMPEPDVKRELYMEDNQPVVYRERITYDVQGIPVEYSENYYISSRFKYYAHMKRIDD